MKIEDCKWIIISAWHWLSPSWKRDVWTIADDWTTEREIVADVANILLSKLESYNKTNFIWIWVEQSLSLTDKISSINNICNWLGLNYKNSILIELHCDYKLASQWTCAYHYNWSNNSKELARVLADNCSHVWNRKTRWVDSESQSRYWKLWIIHDTAPLACIIEMWSMVWKDLDILQFMQEELAQSLFEWILEFLWDKEFINNNNNMEIAWNADNFEKDIKILDELSAKISREWHEVESLTAKTILQDINKIILDRMSLVNPSNII